MPFCSGFDYFMFKWHAKVTRHVAQLSDLDLNYSRPKHAHAHIKTLMNGHILNHAHAHCLYSVFHLRCWKSCHCLCSHSLQPFLSLQAPCVVYLVVTSPVSAQSVLPHEGLCCLNDASFKDEGLGRLNCGCHLEEMWRSLQINFGFSVWAFFSSLSVSVQWVLARLFLDINSDIVKVRHKFYCRVVKVNSVCDACEW